MEIIINIDEKFKEVKNLNGGEALYTLQNLLIQTICLKYYEIEADVIYINPSTGSIICDVINNRYSQYQTISINENNTIGKNVVVYKDNTGKVLYEGKIVDTKHLLI